MNKYLYLIFFACCAVAFAQNNLPNTARPASYSSKPARALLSFSLKNDNDLSLIQKICPYPLRKAFPLPQNAVKRMSEAAVRLQGSDASIKQLTRTFIADSPGVSLEELKKLREKLLTSGIVSNCEISRSGPAPLPGDIMPVTDNLMPMQNYLYANPGVNMEYAWNAGFYGPGVNLRDIEMGYYPGHEEFNDNPGISYAVGSNVSSEVGQGSINHGTATIGLVGADYGTYGTTGLAYGANSVTMYPEWPQTGWDRIAALTRAVEESSQGDILIFEIQYMNWDFYVLPGEADQLTWLLTKAATDAGIVVVAAAGNGWLHLDDFTTYMSWGDSGAILVGAGSSDINHNRLAFSNYGSRVNVQGWGENV
jgi:hypothetical protein